jgi:hypothetical protein
MPLRPLAPCSRTFLSSSGVGLKIPKRLLPPDLPSILSEFDRQYRIYRNRFVVAFSEFFHILRP